MYRSGQAPKANRVDRRLSATALATDSGQSTLNRNMVNGAPIDSYSPSGSTIKLIDFSSTRPSSRPSSQILLSQLSLSWHPKLTLYRLLAIFSTVYLVIAKTATSYLNFTFASIILEWILVVDNGTSRTDVTMFIGPTSLGIK